MNNIRYTHLARYISSKLMSEQLDTYNITLNPAETTVITNPVNSHESLSIDKNHQKTVDKIKSILNDIGVSLDKYTKIKSKSALQTGDIIISNNGNNNVSYMFLVRNSTNKQTVMFPNTIDTYEFKSTCTHEVYRCSGILADSVFDKIKSIIDINNDVEFSETNTNKDTIQLSSSIVSTPGFTKIGDIELMVAPTSISFITQNGYQSFPTIRTHGNPKLPSPSDVRQVQISMIFPNTECINYQLIPLLAMFKRTPFVNFYNKDICAFYSTLLEDSMYLPIALESISIQSVKGFPNTLEATMTILPFSYGAVGKTFRALTTFKDVVAQETNIHITSTDKQFDKTDAKFNGGSYDYSIDYSYDLPVYSTNNFSESIPFRTFYQSLIMDRDYVKDSLGNDVVTKSGTKLKLVDFRPTKETSKLHHYYPSSNRKSITFSYKYIDDSQRNIAKQLNEARLTTQDNISTKTTQWVKVLSDNGTINIDDGVTNALKGTKDKAAKYLYSVLSAPFKTVENYFAMHGLELSKSSPVFDSSCTDPMKYLITSWWVSTGIGSAATFKEAFDKYKWGTITNYNGSNVYNFAGGLTMTDKDGSIVPMEKGIEQAIITLNDHINTITDEKERKYLKQFLAEYLSGDLANYINGTKFMSSASNADFSVDSIPTKEATVVIDNQNDIITGWGINYVNKLIPMKTLAFSLPYYQHIGSEDISLSLNIDSLQNGRDVGLKEELNKMSYRINQSTNLILNNAPELITYLDTKISVSVDGNSYSNIFNAFGLNKLVIQGIQTSNMNGVPNGWNINMNMCQSQIDVTDYHSIESISSGDTYNSIITNLLLRLRKDADGNLKVVRYKINMNEVTSTIKQATTTDYPNLNLDKLKVDIEKDGYGKNAYFQGYNLATGEVSNDINNVNNILVHAGLQSYFNKLTPILVEEESKSETDLIKKAISSDDSKIVLGNLINRLNELYETQMQILTKLDDSVDDPKINDNVKKASLWNILGGALMGTMGLDLTLTGAGAIIATGLAVSTALPVVIGVAAIILGGVVIKSQINDGVENTVNKAITALEPAIRAIADKLVVNMAGEFSRVISRDPYFKYKLFGDKLGNSDTQPIALNTYKDFDVPEHIYKGTNTLGIKYFCPDFYMYNERITSTEKTAYINESLNIYTHALRYGHLLFLTESVKNLQKLDDLNQKGILYLSDDSSNTFTKIQEDIKTAIGSNTSATTDISDINDLIKNLQDVYSGINFKSTKNDVPTNSEGDANYNTSTYNPDAVKANIVTSALHKRLIELKVLETSIVAYAGSNAQETLKSLVLSTTTVPRGKDDAEVAKKLKGLFGSANDNGDYANITDMSANSIKDISAKISAVLAYVTTGSTSSDSTTLKSEVNSRLSTASVLKFERYAYTLMNQIILLQDALTDYNNHTSSEFSGLESIPEIAILRWWNFRELESIKDNKLNIIKEFANNDNANVDGMSTKMFPTFKILFVEDDRALVRNFDDYYSYDAIQSIDVVATKYSPGKTAVIRLSNVMGTLTNKLSLLRENGLGDLTSGNDNIFLGTLDVKPGTKIIIKLGYSSNSNFLKTVFVGRIIEMTPGADCEIIAQSYGSQLNHHVTKLKIGVLSTVRQHGDIASLCLDEIPGLEGLGKPSLLGLNASTFTGRNAGKLIKNELNKFLMSNGLSKGFATGMSSDNPRDENIYLPFSVYQTDKPTFDWVVYDQTVYDALNEITLYHQNSIVTTRPYNDNEISTLDDYRETLVVGNKAGYYKSTDAYSLSSMDIATVDALVHEFNNYIIPCFNKIINGEDAGIESTASVSDMDDNNYKGYILKSNLARRTFQELALNKRYIVVILYLILKNYEDNDNTIMSLVGNILANSNDVMFKLFADKKIPNAIMYINSIEKANTVRFTPNVIMKDVDSSTGGIYNVIKMLPSLKNSVKLSNITAADIAHVDVFNTDNMLPSLATNPQYSKIQRQYLITDIGDIINNNITLSSDFNNAVSVYYLDEPKLYNSLSAVSSSTEAAKLKSFTVKAFGDTSDYDLRILDSFQKNIDTNWYDIIKDSEKFLGNYKKYAEKESELSADWQVLPTWLTVPIALLKREVQKMYTGTVTIVGNPNIIPYDIIHINDSMNDMKGAIEVAEVIHSFNPASGFTTTITPELLVYDRQPVSLNDVGVVQRLFDYTKSRRTTAWQKAIYTTGFSAAALAVGGGIFGEGVGAIPGALVGASIGGVLSAISAIGNSTVGYSKFLYDAVGTVAGRDCLNFTALYYKGVPYFTGFGDVDYTSLNTIISHQWEGLEPVQRLGTANDVELNWILNNGNLAGMSTLQSVINAYSPGIAKLLFDAQNTNYGRSSQ